MNRRPLAGTALSVSELGFGAAPLGNLYAEVDEATAMSAVDAAWDRGVRYFDTAPHYGLGLSERRLGAALAHRDRSEYVVSTKVGRLLVANPAPTGSDLPGAGFAVPDGLARVRDYSAAGTYRSLEASLERLMLDRVDIVLVHDPDDHVDQAIGETIPALLRLRDQGVIGAVGVGTNDPRTPVRMIRETDLELVLLAGRWTLLDRSGGSLLDECLRRGVSVLAAAPFNSGLLARDWPPDDATFDYGPVPADVLARARAVAGSTRAAGVSLPRAALQFPLRHRAVAAVVCGMRSAAEVHANADGMAERIDPARWSELDTHTDRSRLDRA